jgi:drug/metabolite transporter (DMT)-like permease
VSIDKEIKSANFPVRNSFLFVAALLQIVWGIVPSASKLVISEIPVELYIALRWTISGLIFMAVLMMTEGANAIFKKSSFRVGALGVLGYGVGSLGTLYGLKMGGVVNFALISSISPIFTSLISIIFLSEKPARKFWFALPLSIIGALLIVSGKHEISSWSIALTSFLLIASAYAFEAVVFVFSKKLYQDHSRVAYLAIAQFSAAIAMWIAQLFFFHQFNQLSLLDSNGWASAIFVSIVACVLCYYVLHWLILHVPGHKLALFEGLHGISATCFGILFFQEAYTHLMILGGIGILAGLVIGCWPENSPEVHLN